MDRFAIVGALALLAFLTPAGVANDLKPAEVRELALEFCRPGTLDARRAEIVDAFFGVSERKTTSVLKKLAEDVDRADMARLLCAIDHPKAWTIISPYLTGGDEPRILDAIFERPSSGVLTKLCERWRELSFESDSFVVLHERFRTSIVASSAQVSFFVEQLRRGDEDAKAGAALEVVTAVLDLTGVALPSQALVRWKEIEPVFREQSRTFRPGGTPMLGSTSGRSSQRGSNRLLYPDARWSFTNLAAFQNVAHQVVIRFLPVDGDGLTIGYACAIGSWYPAKVGNEMTFQTADNLEAALPLRPGWNELVFAVTPITEGGMRKHRGIVISLNGVGFADSRRLSFDGDLERIYVHTGTSTVVVGGMEIRR